MIELCPEKFRNFGDTENVNFHVLTTSSLAKEFRFLTTGSYQSCNVSILMGDLESAIQKIEQDSHILVIAPDQYLKSVSPHKVGRRKIAVMAANSTPTSIEAIVHFLEVISLSNPSTQQQQADRFFELLTQYQNIFLSNREYQTQARLILSDSYCWNEQLGYLDWGQQQILPAGEISLLPLQHGKFDSQINLLLDGQILLNGRPIVHTGADPNRSEQSYLFDQLAVFEQYPAIANIHNGVIVDICETHPEATQGVIALRTLFEQDHNYQKVWELGFGINSALKLWGGNCAMNEVYGGTDMVLHLGLGLTQATEFHIDLLCPGTNITITNKSI